MKHLRADAEARLLAVAPHAGAWIETMQNPGRAEYDRVAPHAGAWIETKYS